MTSEEPVHPLRLTKNGSMSSPTRTPRPLSEISPMERRRNSPSWVQAPQKMGVNTDSSPFQSSPLEGATSPRLFWKNRENYDSPHSPTRRSSIERLQKASRVKNSNILALEQKQEYDPTRIPQIERPLAKVQENAFGGVSHNGLRSETTRPPLSHGKGESITKISLHTPTKTAVSPSASSTNPPPSPSPSKELGSPMKSSLSSSRFKSSFDHETGTWSGDTSFDERELPDGKALQRHPKSVTFDAAPPQVNEYEMATPDISSIDSNSREGSFDSEDEEDEYYNDQYMTHHDLNDNDSFDASLEDTEKTPVMAPEEWRQHLHGAYDQSPMPDELPSLMRTHHKRTDSLNSSGEHRPLPPLPGMDKFSPINSSSPLSNTTGEPSSGSTRSLPSPPPASDTKLDAQNIGIGKMTLEERLKLLMLSDDGKSAAELQRERRMRRAGPRDHHQTPEREDNSPTVQSPPSLHSSSVRSDPAEDEDDADVGDISGLDNYRLPPRISRESIMRRVNGNLAERGSSYLFSSPAHDSSPGLKLPQTYDPDVPIPSVELGDLNDEDENSEEEGSVIIRREAGEQDDDVYSDISEEDDEHEEDDRLETEKDDADSIGSISDEDVIKTDSRGSGSGSEEDQAPTPRATTPETKPPRASVVDKEAVHRQSLDFSNSLRAYMLPKLEETQTAKEPEKAQHSLNETLENSPRPATPEPKLTRTLTKPEYDGSGWGDDEEFEEEPGTPESVIHHPVPDYEEVEAEEAGEDVEALKRENTVSPGIPERVATIKSASGSKLKTRPSATPSDLVTMREQRRQVSREVPNIPEIPERHRNRLSHDTDKDTPTADFMERHPSFKKRSLTLDLDLGPSLETDFDRVIEAQKVEFYKLVSHQTQPLPGRIGTSSRQPSRQASVRQEMKAEKTATGVATRPLNANITSRKQRGYLMRQNTKVVTASDKDTDDARAYRSAGNSPVKTSRPQSWTVEPWNSSPRKKSVRKRPVTSFGSVPPLPGQESNAMALKSLAEEDVASEMGGEESGERGRLFVKVMGVKDLDLPLPKKERTWFSLTLDNGVHCVTTAWLELARNAPIGQEFELVVPNDLEFQLTLNVKLEKPEPVPKKVVQSPTKTSKPKTSTFSRVFASPRKRREMELMRQREEEERAAQQHRETQARLIKTQPTAWDLLSPLVAEDGSFARAYVCLKEHESRCFGRPFVVDVAAFNEWATEEPGFASSVKSKRGTATVVRRAPYKIGKLELQLLFVPRPKGATDDDMPRSMNSCIREMKAAEERLARMWEGHLSQQGGDCPYWRRRYFKLVGTKLTAYHEATRQPRATINLANAKRLIDDRQALTERETTGKGGKRRRSAFAEEEEGYMFVEEGFRIRFNNGETIDFYADSTHDKDGWMMALGEMIGRETLPGDDSASVSSGRSSGKSGKWCELVVKREEALRKRQQQQQQGEGGRRVHSRTKSAYM